MKRPIVAFRVTRYALSVVAIGTLALVPQSATAAKPKPKPAKLAVVSVASPVATLAAGKSFTISGRVKNTGGRATPALLSFTLSTGSSPATVYTLSGRRISSIKPGKTRAFQVTVTPKTVTQAFPSGFQLQVCAKTSRAATAVCKKASRRIVLQPVPPTVPPPCCKPPVPLPLDNDIAPIPKDYEPGARTLDDKLFPTIGNGGYDALHYDLDLHYTVTSKLLYGTTTITAEATQNLSELSFDLTAWNGVNKVTVDGKAADFDQDHVGNKLIVTPAAGIDDGTTFTVVVTYGGIQQPYIDPDGSQEGFVPSTTYGAIVVSEPVGAMGWYPNNNVPFDKATYTSRVTVPYGFKVVGAGTLQSQVDTGTTPADRSTFTWDDTDPTASYLFGLAIGKFDLSSPDPASPVMTAPVAPTLNTPVPFYTAVDASFTTGKATMLATLNKTPSVLDFYADYYQVKYPFTSAGGIVPRQSVGYSLETQSKPTYATSTSETSTGPSTATMAHENGHMWFGDSVTLTQWKDIWLNEGMTEFSTWLYTASTGGDTLDMNYDAIYNGSTDGFWVIPPADPPTAADIFDSDAMYDRGATTMTAIRQIFINTPSLGEPAFRTMMKRWLQDHAYGNATTERFIALVKATDPTRAARWTEFFEQWLYTSYSGDPTIAGNKPAMNVANFDSYVLPS